MQTNPPQPRVQYIPTVNSVPITPERPSPKPIPPPVEVKQKVKQVYPSLMNKAELMEEGERYGLDLTKDMTRKIMRDKIREAKKNGNIAHSNQGGIS